MRHLITFILLLVAAPAFAQGTIRQATPTTFAAPATIQDWDLKSITFEPGPSARIYVEIVAVGRPDVVLSFEYPRDCGSFGADAQGVPNPPTCPARDTSAEVNTAIGVINSRNSSGANPRLWQFLFGFICTDFPSRFPGGCVVQ